MVIDGRMRAVAMVGLRLDGGARGEPGVVVPLARYRDRCSSLGNEYGFFRPKQDLRSCLAGVLELQLERPKICISSRLP